MSKTVITYPISSETLERLMSDTLNAAANGSELELHNLRCVVNDHRWNVQRRRREACEVRVDVTVARMQKGRKR